MTRNNKNKNPPALPASSLENQARSTLSSQESPNYTKISREVCNGKVNRRIHEKMISESEIRHFLL